MGTRKHLHTKANTHGAELVEVVRPDKNIVYLPREQITAFCYFVRAGGTRKPLKHVANGHTNFMRGESVVTVLLTIVPAWVGIKLNTSRFRIASRGIAIKSPGDEFSFEGGILLAAHRALRATKRREPTTARNESALRSLSACDFYSRKHGVSFSVPSLRYSDHFGVPTPYEVRLAFGRFDYERVVEKIAFRDYVEAKNG